MKEKKLNYNTGMLICFLLSLAVVAGPFALRMLTNPIIPGEEAYYHIIATENILRHNFTGEETGFGLQDGLFHGFLAICAIIISKDAAFLIIPLIVGLSTLIIFFLILQRLNINPEESFMIALFFIFSPIFIYSSYFLNAYSFYLMVSLAAFYLLIIGSRLSYALSLVLYICLSFSDPFVAIINIVCLLAAARYNLIIRRKIAIAISAAALSLILFWSTITYKIGYPTFPEFLARNLLQGFLTDLGGSIGFGTFPLILSLLGLYFLWKDKYQHISLFLLIPIIFLLSTISMKINIFLNVIVSALSGYAFIRLINMKWSREYMKRIMLIILFLGIFVTAFTYSYSIVNSKPSAREAEALLFLKENSQSGEITFSDYQQSSIIEYYSGTKTLVNINNIYDKEINAKQSKIEVIFNSSELEKTKSLLKEMGIKYIYVDRESRERHTFRYGNQGLFYLFRNNETFRKMYENEDAEIWEVIS